MDYVYNVTQIIMKIQEFVLSVLFYGNHAAQTQTQTWNVHHAIQMQHYSIVFVMNVLLYLIQDLFEQQAKQQTEKDLIRKPQNKYFKYTTRNGCNYDGTNCIACLSSYYLQSDECFQCPLICKDCLIINMVLECQTWTDGYFLQNGTSQIQIVIQIIVQLVFKDIHYNQINVQYVQLIAYHVLNMLKQQLL
ncbi:hypothetical protein pb186bvf_005719 [Paramecium bursaria]